MSCSTLFLASNNNVVMYLDGPTANVGIGSTAVPQELSVAGNILGTGNLYLGNSNNTWALTSIAISNSNSLFEIGSGSNRQFSTSAGPGDTTLRTIGTNALILQNGSNGSGIYLSNNLVGVGGQSNPIYAIDNLQTTSTKNLITTTSSSNAGVLQVGGVTYLQGNVCTFNAPQTYQLNVGGNAGFFGQVYFHSNIYMSNATGIATLTSSGTGALIGGAFTATQLNSTTLSNTGNASLSGAITYITNLSNVTVSTNSNVAYFSSNTSIWASNNIVGLSNYVIPIATYGSNTGFFSSNIGIYSSNTANTALTKAIYASNLAVNTNFWSNNANTIYSLSNVGVGLTTANETLSIQGNMSLSNTGSKVIISNSNNNLGIGTATPITALQIAGEILAYNYAKKYKSLATSNSLSIQVTWQNAYSLGSQNFIALQTSQLLGNNSQYGLKIMNHIISCSNYQLFDSTTSISAGNYAQNLNISVIASNSTSVTLSSSTNVVGTGNYTNTFSAEVLSYPSNFIGQVYLL